MTQSHLKEENTMNELATITNIGNTTPSFQEIRHHLDRKHHVAWCYMHARAKPCFTTALLDDLIDWCGYVRDHGTKAGIRYHVIASSTPGIYNLGGDLELFRALIQRQDREALFNYGQKCIAPLFANIAHFESPITTISLVQGDALGGGFETALSSDVLIAEKGSRMGFPEILFNLFPGMGAFSLLSRKLDAKRAERIILSGNIYTAEQLFEMGLVDILAEPGEGEMAVYDYIRRENRAWNGYRALRQARDVVNPISYEELEQIMTIWVDAAMRLEARDLKMMQRLVSRQDQFGAKAA
jgi:DSF synthase